jgi:cobalt-zinc-cadmium efflux system protein
MRRAPYALPPEKQRALARAKRLAWLTVAGVLSVLVALGLSMGSSQLMKAEWVENGVGLVPPLAFLVV